MIDLLIRAISAPQRIYTPYNIITLILVRGPVHDRQPDPVPDYLTPQRVTTINAYSLCCAFAGSWVQQRPLAALSGTPVTHGAAHALWPNQSVGAVPAAQPSSSQEY